LLALVFLGVAIALKRAEAQDSPVRKNPLLLLLAPFRAEWGVYFVAAVDQAVGLWHFAPHE